MQRPTSVLEPGGEHVGGPLRSRRAIRIISPSTNAESVSTLASQLLSYGSSTSRGAVFCPLVFSTVAIAEYGISCRARLPSPRRGGVGGGVKNSAKWVYPRLSVLRYVPPRIDQRSPGVTPTPNPSPQGGGGFTEQAAAPPPPDQLQGEDTPHASAAQGERGRAFNAYIPRPTAVPCGHHVHIRRGRIYSARDFSCSSPGDSPRRR